MVFQKKGATPAKNFQPKGKKAKKQVQADDDDSDMFDDMNDSDDFDDGEMPVQKTPQGKTPKGRQSLSEKKVTFNMSAKNTPNKTPNKNNSLVMKKTPTPAKGKGALQEFKGIKGGKPLQKKGQAADDDDDDDDDDDEDDDDMDEDLDSDDDMDEDDDDDDGDDVDEEDDDEEDDDDDDDEEEEEQKAKQNQANKQKTPIKNENAKNQTPKAKTPKKEVASPKKEATSPKKNSASHSLEIERRRERDSRMLYIGGLPKDVNTDELKSLSPDIINIIIPNSNRKNMKTAFGFLCFTSEAKAEANMKTLQSKKFRGQLLNIDFVGEKSKKKPKTPEEPKINERKLYVTGIPVDATIAEVAAHFPKAFQISFNKSPSFRSASINFDQIEDATEAFESKKAAEIRGSKLIVVHSVVSTMNKKNKRKPKKNKKNANANQGGNPAKKMKFIKKEESDDDEE